MDCRMKKYQNKCWVLHQELQINVNSKDKSSEENVSQVYRDHLYMIYRNKNCMLTRLHLLLPFV